MYKVGLYEREITPFFGNGIDGYFNRREVDGIKDKTYAKAAVIEDGSGEFFALLSVDACGIHDGLVDFVYERANKYIGIKRENLLVAATHSHTAGPGKVIDGKGPEFDTYYINWLGYALADTVIAAYQARKNAKLKYTLGEAKNIAFIRNFIMKDGSFKTNPGRLNPNIEEPIGSPDESVPVILVEDENGNKTGLIYSFGCHQDCVEGTEASGDYSSEVANLMKDKYGREFVSVYFCGTAGNVNDVDVTKADDSDPRHYRNMGKVIFDGIEKALCEAKELEGDFRIATGSKLYAKRVPTPEELKEFKRIFESVELPENTTLDAASPQELFDACMANRAIEYAKSATKYYDIKMQVIRLGTALIFALPGEVFTQYGEKIKAAFKGYDCFFACLANNNWTYMPAKECYLPGLYESLHGSAQFEPDDVVDIFDSIIELGKILVD